MRFSAAFTSALVAGAVFLNPGAHAAGPDDLYLDAYRLVQEGDQAKSAGKTDTARERYEEAQASLKKLKAGYPVFHTKAVEFRLESVEQKLSALPKEGKGPAEATAKTPGKTGNSVQELTERVNHLQAENTTLQAKLQEALAARPAAIDPQELAKAEDRINQLTKEKELLRANISQLEAKQPQAADEAMLQQARTELEATKKKLIESVGTVASLTQQIQALQTSNQNLQQELTALQTSTTEAPKGSEKSQVKELEKERDGLMKKLNEANRELYDVKSRGELARFDTLTNQISNLRARLEVFEARKSPYTAEELALMDKSPKLSTSTTSQVAKQSPKELPAGATLLMAEGDRAFAARRFDVAEAKYKEVLAMDENNPVTLANLAAIQLEQEKVEEAERNLNKALELNPDDAYAMSQLGMVRFRQEKYEQALDLLARSAQIEPKSPQTQNYLGIALSQQGQREGAEAALRKAVQLAPGYADAHHNLAVVYATQKPPFLELAKYHYNKAVSLGHPGNPTLERQMNGDVASN